MAVVEPLGRTADGILVEEVHLRSGLLDVRLLTLGASIRSLEMPDREGTRGNVHLCLPTLSDYEDRSLNPYLVPRQATFARVMTSRSALSLALRFRQAM